MPQALRNLELLDLKNLTFQALRNQMLQELIRQEKCQEKCQEHKSQAHQVLRNQVSLEAREQTLECRRKLIWESQGFRTWQEAEETHRMKNSTVS
jgi:hypothetical protein